MLETKRSTAARTGGVAAQPDLFGAFLTVSREERCMSCGQKKGSAAPNRDLVNSWKEGTDQKSC